MPGNHAHDRRSHKLSDGSENTVAKKGKEVLTKNNDANTYSLSLRVLDCLQQTPIYFWKGKNQNRAT